MIVGVSDAVVAGAPPLSMAVLFTNAEPQPICIWAAAALYVLLTGCVELPAKAENMAIAFWRHVLQVGRALGSSGWPRGRK